MVSVASCDRHGCCQWDSHKGRFSDSFAGDADEGDEYDDPFSGPPDTISLASERYDKDDDGPSDGMWCSTIGCTSWQGHTKLLHAEGAGL